VSSAFGTLSFRNSRYRSQALPGCRIRREYPARCNASGSAIGLCPRCLRACVETVDERKGRRWVTSGLVDVIVGARSIQHNVMARSAKSIANRRGSWASPVVMLSRQDACLRSARRDWSKLSQSRERFAVGSGSYDVVQLSMGRPQKGARYRVVFDTMLVEDSRILSPTPLTRQAPVIGQPSVAPRA